MGVQGLHSVIKPYLAHIHVSKYKGHRVACDAYAWLHRGAISCAVELAEGSKPWVERGYPAPYVEFTLKMVTMLMRNGIAPVLVFDGGRLPAKAGTSRDRRERKQAALEKSRQLMEQGSVEEARSLLAQTVDITADMAAELIAYLRQRDVEFLVAPYEADSQLAYLASLPQEAGGVAAVISEDSDLLAYGVPSLLFKCDRGSLSTSYTCISKLVFKCSGGHAQELRLDQLFAGPAACQGGTATAAGGPAGGVTSFAGWDVAMLQGACVLAGCDFIASIKGVGFKTAHKLLKKQRSLERALKCMRLEKKYYGAVNQEYMQAALRALNNFRHPLVFDANLEGGGGLVRLTPLPPELATGDADLDYLGPPVLDETARGIAYGHLHPRTQQPYPGAPPPPYTTPTIATHQYPSTWTHPAIMAATQPRTGGWLTAGPGQQQQQQHQAQPSAQQVQGSGGMENGPPQTSAAVGSIEDVLGLLHTFAPTVKWASPQGMASAATDQEDARDSSIPAAGAEDGSARPSNNPFARARGKDGLHVAAQSSTACHQSSQGTASEPAAALGRGSSFSCCDPPLPLSADEVSGSAAALQPGLPELQDPPGHISQPSGAGASSTSGRTAELIQRCSGAEADEGTAVPPLVPITNLPVDAARAQQLSATQVAKEAGASRGCVQLAEASTGTQSVQQQQQHQQQARQQGFISWPARAAPSKRPPALPAGPVGKASGGKKRKGTMDASQLRISNFFPPAPQ